MIKPISLDSDINANNRPKWVTNEHDDITGDECKLWFTKKKNVWKRRNSDHHDRCLSLINSFLNAGQTVNNKKAHEHETENIRDQWHFPNYLNKISHHSSSMKKTWCPTVTDEICTWRPLHHSSNNNNNKGVFHLRLNYLKNNRFKLPHLWLGEFHNKPSANIRQVICWCFWWNGRFAYVPWGPMCAFLCA